MKELKNLIENQAKGATLNFKRCLTELREKADLVSCYFWVLFVVCLNFGTLQMITNEMLEDSLSALQNEGVVNLISRTAFRIC